MLFLKSRGITRKKADSEIQKGQEINEATQIVMNVAFTVSGNKPGKAFFKEAYNAFVFSRDSVLKYFYGPNYTKPVEGAADVLVVITGAHDADEIVDGVSYKTGERTAIICGMIAEKDAEQKPVKDADGNTILHVVDPSFVLGFPTTAPDVNVADQYPPRLIFKQLPALEGDLFEVLLKDI